MKSRLPSLGLAFVFAGTTFAAFNPIPITPGSFNADVVVEKTATPVLKVVTTASVDQGQANGANTWMEVGFDPANPANGLPAPGTIITPPLGDVVFAANTVAGVNTNNPSVVNYSFQMPSSYTEPNGILINTVITNGTLALTTPAAYTRLSFLGSGGNGGDVIGVTVRHQDGTTEGYSVGGAVNNAYTFGCPDWFSGTSNVAFIANERAASTVNLTYGNVNSGNPRLYFRDIVLTNTTSPVTNLTLHYVSGSSGSHNDVLAVSGAKTVGGLVQPIAVTGWTYDFIVEAAAAKRARVTTTQVLDGTNVWATTQSMDNLVNTGNTWYEVGYNQNNPDGGGVPIPDSSVSTNSGLPVAGATITNGLGDHSYTMPASYAANNAVYLNPSNNPTATITLATPFAVAPVAPASASILSFLAAAGNGPVTLPLVVRYQDGSTETTAVVVPDWFNAAASMVWNANGRVNVETAQFDAVRRNPNAPRLFNCDVTLTKTTSAITSIDVTYTNTGGRVAIFALAGTTGSALASFTSQPTFRTVNPGDTVQFTASAIANSPISYRWQKGTNGVFANLSDGGKISGALTTTLTVSTVDVTDGADYRVVATDAAGDAFSSAATLTVLSPLADVTAPGDPITAFGFTGLFGDGPAANSIDNSTLKLGGNMNAGSQVGFVVTPAMGSTIVTGFRVYAANDTESRDPASFKLEGAPSGSTNYTLIYSNALNLPAARSPAPNAATGLDPLNQSMNQRLFANTNGYTSYRVTFTSYKGGAGQGSFQIAEAELLGVQDTSGKPSFSQNPTLVKVFPGSPASFTAAANGNPTPVLFWRKGTNGVYVNLTDNANITGSQTGNLNINSAQLADVADYIAVATNISGSVTSTIARLLVLNTSTDVTVPSDTITAFGGDGAANGGNGVAPSAIDDLNSTIWQNGGSGLNSAAGFAPFGGPVGLIVTPAMGVTKLVGLRIYTSTGNSERDPMDYKLEGSNDGGTNYTLISQGALDLPLDRANNALSFDPTVQPVQEVLFANAQGYATYRVSFAHTRSDNDANSLQIGEVELLGVPGTVLPDSPVLSIARSGNGFTISATGGSGTLYSTTNLTSPVWKSEGAISGSVNITPVAGEPTKFYQIRP